MKKKIRIGMVSLGCPKNLVDSEHVLGQLTGDGFEVTPDPASAEVIIVNTCGFIEGARQESVDAILDMAEHKQTGACRRLIVTGCLVQGYAADLKKELPEVDAFLGSADYAGVAQVVRGLLKEKEGTEAPLELISEPAWLGSASFPRLLTTPPYMAYLKIGEGCDHACTFCAIPKLRGRMRSRRVEDIVAEAAQLAQRGVRELNVISQDTSEYGRDLEGKPQLKRLIQELDKVEGLEWIRLHYLFPAFLDDAVLDAFAAARRVVKYVDLPLQHADDAMLKAMRRPGTRKSNLELLERFRKRVPGVALRSSFIVGYPGETEEQFRSLLDFFGEAQLDRVGVFAYSQEALTPSGALPNQLGSREKERRRRLALKAATSVSARLLKAKVGAVVRVLVEGSASGEQERLVDSVEHGTLAPRREAAPTKGLWWGRSAVDAPDIDGRVYFKPKGRDPKAGAFVEVRLERAAEHDLFGVQA
jgi:ribosomal protein S12 methylthiotransferase